MQPPNLRSNKPDHDNLQIDPLVSGTNARRSEKDLAKMLDLIDNLPISTAGKDGQA